MVGLGEKIVEGHTGNSTSIAVRKAEYREQANKMLASVCLVFHTYLSWKRNEIGGSVPGEGGSTS